MFLNKRILILGAVTALTVANIFYVFRIRGAQNNSENVVISEKLQCGHWALIRCCHLLGLPLYPNDAVRLLPYHRARGQSLLELKQALEDLGFQVVAKSQSLVQAVQQTEDGKPVILHLTNPDHFVVLSRQSGRDVFVFDAVGQRRRLPLELVRERFDGYSLTVQRQNESLPLPQSARREIQSAPCLQFKTLYVDLGDVSVTQAAMTFEFPLQNLGGMPLKIDRIASDCSCLQVEGPEEVPPYSDGLIRATFSHQPGRSPSSFEHEIHVVTNDPLFKSVVLIAAGNTNTNLSVFPFSLDFGKVAVGQTQVRRCFVQYNGQEASVLEKTQFECTLPHSTIRILTTDEFQSERPLGQHLVETQRLPGQVRVVEIVWSPLAELPGKRLTGYLRVMPPNNIAPIDAVISAAVTSSSEH